MKANKIVKKSNKKTQEISKTDKLSAKSKVILALCGALIGFINGFFGGGGGMICVPLLEKVLHLGSKYSHATAIVIILPISFVSAVIYFLSGNLETVPFLTVGSGVLLGGIVGSYLLKFLPEKALKIIFAIVMLAGGIRLLF
ncbi:MAG: TSUP family transporter [Candidatus Caccovivens sp.]